MIITLILILLVEDMFCLFYFLMLFLCMVCAYRSVTGHFFFIGKCCTLMKSDAGCKLCQANTLLQCIQDRGCFRGNLPYFQENVS